MIVWRALQGFIGGGMIPTVFASAFTIFPRSQAADHRRRSSASSRRWRRPSARRSAAISPTCSPGTGCSWSTSRPGIMVTIAAWLADRFRQARLSAARPQFDWTGLVAMAAFLGALEYALEEGPSKDWFESEPVTLRDRRFGARRASCSSGARSRAQQPIVDLTRFRDRNFWTGSLFVVRAWASGSTA